MLPRRAWSLCYELVARDGYLSGELRITAVREPKITLAKSFLRDEALRWWGARENNVQRALASGDASLVALTPAINTWNDFQKAVLEYFCPRGASDEARNELHRLRQNQFRSLEAYADCFEAVSRRIEVSVGQSIEEELIATFKAGLMDGLIRLSLTNTRPRTLFQAIQPADQAESDLRVSGARANPGRQNYWRRSFDARVPQHRFSGNHFGRFRSSGETSLAIRRMVILIERLEHPHQWISVQWQTLWTRQRFRVRPKR